MNANTSSTAVLGNGSAVAWRDVPELPVQQLVDLAAGQIENGGRLCAWFGVNEPAGVRIVAVIAQDAENALLVARSELFSGGYEALTPRHAQA
ncbi:MAG TPA: hydrogenase, partial [Verrucomicrobiota bacterium]|nr:hydrogenase [Verrucomicrobiota bacterium]